MNTFYNKKNHKKYLHSLSWYIILILIIVYYTMKGDRVMKTKIAKAVAESRKKIAKCVSVVTAFMLSTCCFIASSISAETDLGKNLENTGQKFLNEFAAIYCNSVGWLLLGVNICILLFSKNDKLVGFAKKAAVVVFVLYVLLKILVASNAGIIGTTANTVTTWVSGS